MGNRRAAEQPGCGGQHRHAAGGLAPHRLPDFSRAPRGTLPTSTYRPGQPGNEFKPEAAPLPGETIIVKHTNSAFIGTEFDRLLRQSRIYTLVIMGVITNNSLEATVRMSGNLGFETYLVEDASFTFARKDYRGRLRTGEEVHDMSLANLDRQYCTVAQTKQVLQAVTREDQTG
jgi:nicotinamidase-related amidase